jgi:hypothetical protein
MVMKRLLGLANLVFILVPTLALSDDATTLKEIMQGLRNNLVEITDGLLVDDFGQISRGAVGIAEHPRIPPEQVQLVAQELGAEMPAFKRLDTLVHDLALEIDVAAKARDRNAAISGYAQLLDGCFACHADYKDRVAAVLDESD